jgi:uncharacterized protein
MKLAIRYRGEPLVSDVLLATSFWDRLIGLMFRNRPPQNSQGLMIDPCNSIHTCFMKYPLDVIFLDASNRIIKVIYDLKPWRFTWIYFKARKTLEIPSGLIVRGLEIGEELEVLNV